MSIKNKNGKLFACRSLVGEAVILLFAKANRQVSNNLFVLISLSDNGCLLYLALKLEFESALYPISKKSQPQGLAFFAGRGSWIRTSG